MKTRRNKCRRNTRRGGGPKKNNSASTKKKDPDREFEETVEMINLLNTKYSETGVKTGDVEKLISALELLIPSKGFNAKQKKMLQSILDINAENTANCQLLNPKKKDCDFLEGFVDRITTLIGPDSPHIANAPHVATVKPAPLNKSFAAIMKKDEPVLEPLLIPFEDPKKQEPLLIPFEEPKKQEPRKNKKKSRKSSTEPVMKNQTEPLITSVLNPPMESVLNPPTESVLNPPVTEPIYPLLIPPTKSKPASMTSNEIVARMFVTKYVFPDAKKMSAIEKTYNRPFLHTDFENEIDELTQLRDTIHTEDSCVFLKSLFPSFQIKSSKHKTILCTMLFLIGKISYLLNSNYAIGAGDYYILVKGGTALKLMANHPDFIYESEDIDLLVMTRPGIPYDQGKLSDFVDGLANYVKWFLNDPQIIIEPQKGGLKVLKLYYGKHGLCDIDYQDHSAEDTHMFYENVHTILHKNHKLLFNYQSEDEFFGEKRYLYHKYKHECAINECDKEENKKNPECRLCLYLQTKFEKSIKAMTRLNFLRR